MYAPTKEQITERWDGMPDILKDAMHSILARDEMDAVQKNFHLSDDKADDLYRLVRGVFYGFIHTEDLYKEIRDSLQIDSRLALDIYHELDKKIFDSFRKEIDDNFIRYKIGAIKEAEVAQPQVPQQVVLKEGPEVINLKPEFAAEASIKIKVEEERKPAGPAPMPIGQAGATPEMIVSTPVTPKPEMAGSVSKPTEPSTPVSEGPMIIHQREESQSIAQAQATSPFRQTSFGGYMGAFRTFSGQAPQAPVSSAKIEMPSEQKPRAAEVEEQKIPVVVKKYEEEPVKTIHYSDLRTPLMPKKEEKPPIQPIPQPQKENPPGMIDLTNLTFKK